MAAGKMVALSALLLVALALVGALNTLLVQASFDAEMASLADLFSGNKLSGSGAAGQPIPASEADGKMRELYAHIERVLTEARQLSANSRSALISSKIDTLRL